MPRDHVATTSLYRRMVRTLSASSDASRKRKQSSPPACSVMENGTCAGALLRAANVETLLDTGYPPPEEVLPRDELGSWEIAAAEPMLRVSRR